jgi:hypothetical protein
MPGSGRATRYLMILVAAVVILGLVASAAAAPAVVGQ